MIENNITNITHCASNSIPTISSYLSATNKYGIALVIIGALALLAVLIVFVDTLNYIIKNSSSQVKAHSAFVIGVYPVIALATYFAILVPRAHLLAEALTQGIFMVAMYQLFCLFVAYCDGEAEVVRKAKSDRLNLQVLPCCCWPCCFCLPTIKVTKKSIGQLRLMVLQLPVVQGLVYMTLLVMWAERESLYQINYMYLQPVIILSILFGVWGMTITINLLRGFLGDEFLMPVKFTVLQLVLVLAKLQGLIARTLVWTDALPCNSPITPTVYANLLYNTCMLGEMLALGLVARKYYKRTLPVLMVINNNNNNNNICKISNGFDKDDKGIANVAVDLVE